MQRLNTHLKSIKKNPLLLLQCQPDHIPRFIIYDTVLIFWDTIFLIDISLKEPSRRGIISNLLASTGDGGAIFGTIDKERSRIAKWLYDRFPRDAGRESIWRSRDGNKAGYCCISESGCRRHGALELLRTRHNNTTRTENEIEEAARRSTRTSLQVLDLIARFQRCRVKRQGTKPKH